MSPLAEAIYELLRLRVVELDPRITYRQLALELRDQSADFEFVHHRNKSLYLALDEVGEECRRLGLPSLAALVVRADTRRPGDAYYAGMTHLYRGERVNAWRQELEAVKQARYPAREAARSEGQGGDSVQSPDSEGE